MSDKSVKEKLAHGQVTIGTWMQLPDSSIAEILSASGYDWIAVDLEHGLFSAHQLPDIFRAIELHGAEPMARVAQAAMKDIKHALEAGARGIILPMIESRVGLENAISHIKYSPAGFRGVGFSRANLYGKNFEDYFTKHNDRIVVVAQIENVRALPEMDGILSVPGLDAIMIGPYDLSCSMGLTGQFDHPDFRKAVAEIRESALRSGIPFGMHVVQPNEAVLSERIAEGYTWIAYGTDAIFLNSACQCPKIN